MTDTYTIVIERRDGEALDMDDVIAKLRDDYKVSTWMPGHHLMVKSQLLGVSNHLRVALASVQSALGEPTEFDEQEGDGG